MRVQQEKPIEWQTLSLFQEASNGEDSDRENLKKMINDMVINILESVLQILYNVDIISIVIGYFR